MTKKPKKKPSDPWAEAKKKCRLNQEEVEMAKKLGLNPRKLIANNASVKQEQWKEPVREWIRKIYQKSFGDKQERTE